MCNTQFLWQCAIRRTSSGLDKAAEMQLLHMTLRVLQCWGGGGTSCLGSPILLTPRCQACFVYIIVKLHYQHQLCYHFLESQADNAGDSNVVNANSRFYDQQNIYAKLPASDCTE